MILRAMPAVALTTGRVTLAGQVEGDGPDERGYPGPPCWELCVRLTTSPCKKLILTKPYNKPRNVMNARWRQGTGCINEWRGRARDREAWRRIVKEAKTHPGL